MTLILGMSKTQGIYMSVDYRVTKGGEVVDDTAGKFLSIRFPPDDGGARMLLGYTGVASSRDGTPTGSWIRQTLRGEAEYPDQAMAHLRERLDRDYGPMRQPLIVNWLGIYGDQRFFGGLSNVHKTIKRPLLTFDYQAKELDGP